MIKKIQIKNLKSIKEIEINPKAFNVFTGTNSSGKSTTIQALLLASQNLENKYGLNGPLAAIGEFREVRNYITGADKIDIAIVDDEGCVTLQFGDSEPTVITTEGSLADRLNYSNNHFHYLSCNRIGTKDIFTRNRTVYKGVGITGEYTIDYLSQNKDEPLEDVMIKDSTNLTLLAQVNNWLNYIVNASIRVESIIGTDAVKAEYGIVDGRFSRPQNVGSGISYLISIIVLCLASKRNDIIVIENPEIHLHPMSQSRLCEFLYFISKAGRQIFIETHSDHFFNSIRAGIATGEIEKDNVLIEFFKLGSDNCTRNYDIAIGKYGAIENPIPNLFDQFQADMDKMIGV